MRRHFQPSPNPMKVIRKDSINKWIVPRLRSGKRGGKLKVEQGQIIAAILYKLKTGCHWRKLPTKEFFNSYRLRWQGVYYPFRRWIQDGSIRKVWIELLKQQRKLLVISCVPLDGSQTICKNGGECLGYPSRKAARSCNSLFLADKQGLMLACRCPLAGQHQDLCRIKQVFEEVCDFIKRGRH